ncbi:MAG: 4Fe-4S binding protein [Candidatus Micrarchaeota archaeon]
MANILSKGVITVDLDKCTGCGVCVKVCPMNIYEMKNGKTSVKPGAEDDCIQCHACEVNCPVKAITIG